jgi:hypothetical protein
MVGYGLCHCEGGAFPPEAIFCKIGDRFAAKKKNAARNDMVDEN